MSEGVRKGRRMEEENGGGEWRRRREEKEEENETARDAVPLEKTTGG